MTNINQTDLDKKGQLQRSCIQSKLTTDTRFLIRITPLPCFAKKDCCCFKIQADSTSISLTKFPILYKSSAPYLAPIYLQPLSLSLSTFLFPLSPPYNSFFLFSKALLLQTFTPPLINRAVRLIKLTSSNSH